MNSCMGGSPMDALLYSTGSIMISWKIITCIGNWNDILITYAGNFSCVIKLITCMCNYFARHPLQKSNTKFSCNFETSFASKILKYKQVFIVSFHCQTDLRPLKYRKNDLKLTKICGKLTLFLLFQRLKLSLSLRSPWRGRELTAHVRGEGLLFIWHAYGKGGTSYCEEKRRFCSSTVYYV
jgi:hypothetical protein